MFKIFNQVNKKWYTRLIVRMGRNKEYITSFKLVSAILIAKRINSSFSAANVILPNFEYKKKLTILPTLRANINQRVREKQTSQLLNDGCQEVKLIAVLAFGYLSYFCC